MKKLRYNRTFKKGIGAIIFCVLLFGSMLIFSIVAKVQYDSIIADMEIVEATIVDIDLEIHTKGPSEQEIYITYMVDGVVYNRELETDTSISFSPGRGANYSIGDKIEIFYDPDNPETIAFSRSVKVGYNYMVISLVGLGLVIFSLIAVLKKSRTFLVTQEEYEKEKEELKKAKLKRKKNKNKKNEGILRKIGKIILIILGIIVILFILFLLLGAILSEVGY